MVQLGSEFIWLWFLENKQITHMRVHVKGLRSKQNIQPKITSLILFDHSKSNVLLSEIPKLLI
jgi:hypothetical protein